MTKYIDPFLYNVKKIDIHGYDRYGALAIVDNFIDNCISLQEEKLIIIHGKGLGILRKSVHEYLKKDKRILEYKLNYHNDGETIVILKKEI